MKKIILTITLLIYMTACNNQQEVITPSNLPDSSSQDQNIESDILISEEIVTERNAYPLPSTSENDQVEPYPNEEKASDEFQITVSQWPAFEGKILFHSGRRGVLEIFSMSGATGDLTPLISGNGQAFEPNYNQDCSLISYVSNGGNSKFAIYSANSDGSNTQKIVESDSASAWGPIWSPSGSKIAYTTNPNALLNVCIYDMIEQQSSCLERGEWSNATPHWAPDEESLVFSSNRDGDWEIYSITLNDERDLNQLTNNSHSDLRPQYSPNGQSISYDANPNGQFDIYIMKSEDSESLNSDGTKGFKVTESSFDDKVARWIGNSHLVWSSTRTLDGDLYMSDTDGNQKLRLTNAIGSDSDASWCNVP